MKLHRTSRSSWLETLVEWVVTSAPKPLRPVAASVLSAVPQAASNRVAAVRLTLATAQHHPEFRKLAREADACRDKHDLANAEFAYWQALQIFPLHGGYRVQYAHMLKDQHKFVDAVVHYCFALAAGAPLQDVSEHLLFAAGRAGLRVGASEVQRLAQAWSHAEQTLDDWDAPPVHADFVDFASLLWGNVGLLTLQFMQSHLLKCTTRKSLFLSLLGSPETPRYNRLFFVMMNEKGAADVRS